MAERVLPQEFSEMLREAVGHDLAGKITEAILTTPPVTSIRKNPAKWPRLAAAGHSPTAGLPEVCGRPDQIPWCPDGLYLAERPNFTMDPAFHAGAYYVQEPSSMIIEVLRPLAAGASRLLDLCAAPGGKTTHLASMMGGAAGSPAEETLPRQGLATVAKSTWRMAVEKLSERTGIGTAKETALAP
ncbi:MAG: hypothetical protein QMB82_07500 [Bacteroidales bacterium]